LPSIIPYLFPTPKFISIQTLRLKPNVIVDLVIFGYQIVTIKTLSKSFIFTKDQAAEGTRGQKLVSLGTASTLLSSLSLHYNKLINA
jgi:hypothetical protein